jgi:predicted negative regulator of RcsB-dependent stress response
LMALEMMDEHEKGEAVRAWIRQNGSAIIGGVALGLALIFGYQWWERSKAEHRLTAATQYQAVTEAAAKKDLDALGALSAELTKTYADTPYALLAALQLADARINAGQVKEARAALDDAARLSAEPALLALIELRRARLALAEKDAEAAIKLVDAMPKDMYAGLAAEIRGDALLSLGRTDDAREAYSTALIELETGAPNRRIVEMKLADLGGAPAPAEAS